MIFIASVAKFAAYLFVGYAAHAAFHWVRDGRAKRWITWYRAARDPAKGEWLHQEFLRENRIRKLLHEGVPTPPQPAIHVALDRAGTVSQHRNPAVWPVSWRFRTFDAHKRDEVESAYVGRCDRCRRCDCRFCFGCGTSACRSQWHAGSIPTPCNDLHAIDEQTEWSESRSYFHPDAEFPTLCFGLMRAFVRYRDNAGGIEKWPLVLCEPCAHKEGVRIGWCDCDGENVDRRILFGAVSQPF